MASFTVLASEQPKSQESLNAQGQALACGTEVAFGLIKLVKTKDISKLNNEEKQDLAQVVGCSQVGCSAGYGVQHREEYVQACKGLLMDDEMTRYLD